MRLKTNEATAKADKHYKSVDALLTFGKGVTELVQEIELVDNDIVDHEVPCGAPHSSPLTPHPSPLHPSPSPGLLAMMSETGVVDVKVTLALTRTRTRTPEPEP